MKLLTESVLKNEVRLGFFQVSFKYEFISTIFCYICSFSAVFGQYLDSPYMYVEGIEKGFFPHAFTAAEYMLT